MKVLVDVLEVAVVLVFVMVEVEVVDADVVLEDVIEIEVRVVDDIDAVVVDDELVVSVVKVLVLVEDVLLYVEVVFVYVEVVFNPSSDTSERLVILVIFSIVSLKVSFEALSMNKELNFPTSSAAVLRSCKGREL